MRFVIVDLYDQVETNDPALFKAVEDARDFFVKYAKSLTEKN
jgi:hypothetical protein